MNFINDNYNKDYFICEMPTGTGKSSIAYCISNSNRRAYIITSTKQLQDQYIKDFEDIKSIKGKSHYRCNMNNKFNCSDGPCKNDFRIGHYCRIKNKCPYIKARMTATNSKIYLTNYSFLFNNIHRLGKRDIIIFDEAQLLEKELSNWATFSLDVYKFETEYKLFENVDMRYFVQLSDIPKKTGKIDNQQWLIGFYNLIKLKYEQESMNLKNRLNIKNIDNLSDSEILEISFIHKNFFELSDIKKKFDVFMSINNEIDWNVEPIEFGLKLSPINSGLLFHRFVKRLADKFIFFSATIPNEALFRLDLGLERKKSCYISIESPFDSKKSPIIYIPITSLNYTHIDENIPKLIPIINNILENHLNEKGIIHCGNYKICKFLKENLKNKRLLIKKENETNENLIKRHTTNKKPTVILSPSLTTGVDLKDDLSRFQIIIKMPWLSLNDNRIAEKNKRYGGWYLTQMMNELIQACGRSTRTEEDYSTTYVLDNSFFKWCNKYKYYLSKQFLNRIIWDNDYHKNKIYSDLN
jgi:Rad3-related DNA helicase